MKKRLALLLTAVLAVGSLTACGGNAGSEKVSVGLGAVTSFSSSYSIGEEHYGAPAEATNAQVDFHVAAVTLGADGKILSCDIDAVQVKATVDATGAIADDAATTFPSKNDLKDGYNMKIASSIGKEWYEQVNNYEQWVVGKTVDEVKAGVSAEGTPADETLLTGCTIGISDITAAVVDACEKATETDASANDTLALALIGELTNYAAPSTDEAGNPKDGTFQAYINFAATTKNADGKITSVFIDSIQASPTWGTDGILTTNVEQDVRTKYTKQGDYGMQKASSLEKGEWFQQIDAFKMSILGKTADEVTAIAADEKGYPTDETLRTGCTMKIAPYKEVVVKALSK